MRPIIANLSIVAATVLTACQPATHSFQIHSPKPPEPKEKRGYYYAPGFRIVRCARTVDSNAGTPIIGIVTDDLMWNGHVIIARGSTVQGMTRSARNAKQSADTWTFTLDPSNPNLGHKLMLKGMALDENGASIPVPGKRFEVYITQTI